MRRLLVLLASALLGLPATATVWVVDPTGAGNFFDIQSAVDAAADGDTILVRTGTYSSVLVNGKGLRLGAEAGATVQILGSLRIVNLLPGQTMEVRDLDTLGVNNLTLADGIGLYVDGNQGPVSFSGCSFEGAVGEGGNTCNPTGHITGFAGSFVRNSVEVAFEACSFEGGKGAGPDGSGILCYESIAGDGGIGLDVLDASVSLCAVAVLGGEGGPTGLEAGDGGHGLRVKGPLGSVLSVGSSYTGGKGGFAWDFISVQGGDGGDGFRVGPSAAALSYQDQAKGGLPGKTLVCCPGQPGQAFAGTGALALLGPYCTAGTSSSGCAATLSSTGLPSASAASGFVLAATGVEGAKDGLFFWGTGGQQSSPWGNGTSFQCVVPPVSRGALLAGSGTPGACDGSFSYDLCERWSARPLQNPGPGAVVQAQLWYRDPQNTSNQTTGLSDALEFPTCP